MKLAFFQVDQPLSLEQFGRETGFTLAEVVVAMAITGLMFVGIINGYVQSARESEWSGYSLAAQALSVQQVEQFRAARWDPRAVPPVDETLNLPTNTVTMLDLPVSEGNIVWATNYMSLFVVPCSTNSSARVKMIRVDTVWEFRGRLYTNTTATYRAPDK